MTASQDQGQQEAGGPDVWLDMSRYADTDPDTVLSPDEHSLLTTSLAVDDAELPDAVWEHMLAVVVGDAEPAPEDTTDGTDAEPPADGDDWAGDVVADHEEPDAHDPADDPAAEPDGHHDDGGWV